MNCELLTECITEALEEDSMNKTDKRQFLDEIEMMGKTKQHSSTFIQALKESFIAKSLENMLYEKRKVYNFAYVNLYRKYGIKHDDLIGELDKIWKVCLKERKKSSQEELVKALATMFASGARVDSTAWDPYPKSGEFATFIDVLAHRWPPTQAQYTVSRLWKSYKRNAWIYAEKYVDSLK